MTRTPINDSLEPWPDVRDEGSVDDVRSTLWVRRDRRRPNRVGRALRNRIRRSALCDFVVVMEASEAGMAKLVDEFDQGAAAQDVLLVQRVGGEMAAIISETDPERIAALLDRIERDMPADRRRMKTARLGTINDDVLSDASTVGALLDRLPAKWVVRIAAVGLSLFAAGVGTGLYLAAQLRPATADRDEIRRLEQRIYRLELTAPMRLDRP